MELSAAEEYTLKIIAAESAFQQAAGEGTGDASVLGSAAAPAPGRAS